MKSEVIVLNEEREVSLTAYIQEVGGLYGFTERPAVLILPGGGYSICADIEADPVALAYAKAGYQTFILRYTVVSKGRWPMPLQDYEEAMELIISRAEEWHVAKDKIAVIGFSAGGHLAACAATIAAHKPTAALLIYPSIVKEFCDACQLGMPYPHEHVDLDTAPCFIAACWDDHVDINNSMRFELALNEKGVPFESHIYSCGNHGFSTAEKSFRTNPATERLANWVPDSISWLGETMGELIRDGFTEPAFPDLRAHDNLPVLSVDCTLRHICKQGDEVKEILAPLFDFFAAARYASDYAEPDYITMMGKSKIRDLLKTVPITDEEIDRIDLALHGIENQR